MSKFEKILETMQLTLLVFMGGWVFYFLIHILAYVTGRPHILS